MLIYVRTPMYESNSPPWGLCLLMYLLRRERGLYDFVYIKINVDDVFVAGSGTAINILAGISLAAF